MNLFNIFIVANDHCFIQFSFVRSESIPGVKITNKEDVLCSLSLYYGQAASAIDIQLVPVLVHSYLRIGVELES